MRRRTRVSPPTILLEVTALQPASHIVRELPPHPASAGAARREVDDALRQWGCEAVRNAVLVVTSELVTNAIVHGGSWFTITLTRTRDAVRVEVRDRSRGRAVLTAVGVDAAHGRGLQLVDRLSSEWDSYRTADDDKVVW